MLHCDNCAESLEKRAYVEAVVHDMHVICCSGRCVADLLRVWAPSKRTLPWQQTLALIGMVCWAILL